MRAKNCIDSSLILIGSLLLISMIFLSSVLWQFLGGWPPHTGIHEQTQAQQAYEVANSPLGRSGGLPIDRRSDNSETQDTEPYTSKNALDYIKDARDLHAQEGVWRASFVVAILAFSQTLIGVFGLILIARTLSATSATLREAKRTTSQAGFATEAAVKTLEAAITKDSPNIRAGVACSFVNVGRSHFRAIGSFINVGQTTAFDVRIRAKFIRRDDSGFNANQSVGPIDFRCEQIIAFKETGEESRLELKEHNFPVRDYIGDKKQRLYFVVDIDYSTIFNQSLNKKMIVRVKPFSFHEIAYMNQLKINKPENASIANTEALASDRRAAEDPANVLRFDTYECDISLAVSALDVLADQDSKIIGNSGMSMPSHGLPDKDE